jgi:hypothetical protein
MSYKFDVYRCDDCGAVWFAPPLEDDAPPVRPCRIVYERENGEPRACGGRVYAWAGFDSDSFTVMYGEP